MTPIQPGMSATVALDRDGSVAVVSTGFFNVTVTLLGGPAGAKQSFGPESIRQTFGPYAEGATVVLENVTGPLMYQAMKEARPVFDQTGSATLSDGTPYALAQAASDPLPSAYRLVTATGQVVASNVRTKAIRCLVDGTLTLRDSVVQTFNAADTTSPVKFTQAMVAGDTVQAPLSFAFGIHATVAGTTPSFELEF